ncbi:MAG: hypothetical protein KDB00_07125 [Planctomycetales bacterium]|nr:hypothetical protein [Planctomycetales bacterium]
MNCVEAALYNSFKLKNVDPSEIPARGFFTAGEIAELGISKASGLGNKVQQVHEILARIGILGLKTKKVTPAFNEFARIPDVGTYIIIRPPRVVNGEVVNGHIVMATIRKTVSKSGDETYLHKIFDPQTYRIDTQVELVGPDVQIFKVFE